MSFEDLTVQHVADNVESNSTSETISVEGGEIHFHECNGTFLEHTNAPLSDATASVDVRHARIAPKIPHQDDLLVALKMLLFEACRFHNVEVYRRGVMTVVKQLDQLWNALEGTPEQKYEFLRARIQALFLWDRTTNGLSRDLLCPPQAMLEVFYQQRANRLRALPCGSLFFPPPCEPGNEINFQREECNSSVNSIII
jgi:hypothetical protein